MRGAAILTICAMTVASCGSGSASPDERSSLPPRAKTSSAESDGGAVDAGKPPFPDEGDASTLVSDDECDRNKPFGTPQLLLDPATKSATPRLSHDERTIYFTSDGTTTATDLFRAVRTSRSEPFGAATSMTAQSSSSNDNDPAPSLDHLSLFFHSGRSGNNELWFATRTSTADDFGTPSLVPNVNDAAVADAHAYYRSGGGGELYFVSLRGGATTYHVYVAKKDGAGFATPSKLDELSGDWNDWQPMVTEDGLTMLFASDRPTAGSAFHLWIANRATDSDAWGTPQKIVELESATAPDFAGWISADRCRIYFSSSRDSTMHRVYFASRPR